MRWDVHRNVISEILGAHVQTIRMVKLISTPFESRINGPWSIFKSMMSKTFSESPLFTFYIFICMYESYSDLFVGEQIGKVWALSHRAQAPTKKLSEELDPLSHLCHFKVRPRCTSPLYKDFVLQGEQYINECLKSLKMFSKMNLQNSLKSALCSVAQKIFYIHSYLHIHMYLYTYLDKF